MSANGQVIYGNQNTQTTIYGVSEEYLAIRKLTIESGRIFNAGEVRSMSKVCILGQTVIEEPFWRRQRSCRNDDPYKKPAF